MKQLFKYPYNIGIRNSERIYPIWRNFLDYCICQDDDGWIFTIDVRLKEEYRAVRAYAYVQFETERDKIMFLLRFS